MGNLITVPLASFSLMTKTNWVVAGEEQAEVQVSMAFCLD